MAVRFECRNETKWTHPDLLIATLQIPTEIQSVLPEICGRHIVGAEVDIPRIADPKTKPQPESKIRIRR